MSPPGTMDGVFCPLVKGASSAWFLLSTGPESAQCPAALASVKFLGTGECSCHSRRSHGGRCTLTTHWSVPAYARLARWLLSEQDTLPQVLICKEWSRNPCSDMVSEVCYYQWKWGHKDLYSSSKGQEEKSSVHLGMEVKDYWNSRPDTHHFPPSTLWTDRELCHILQAC